MKKRDALKLQPGSAVCFSRSRNIADGGPFFWAEVVHVTQNAGIRVEHEDGYQEWIGYHHVINVAEGPPSSDVAP